MRKAIADHMVESLHNAAQLTISLEVDATELVNLRERILPGFEAAIGVRPTFTDLLVVLTTKALQQHPLLNSTTEGDEIILHQPVNMGVAVAIESGLIVPVILGAQNLGLGDISRTRFELARKASEGRIGYEDVQGGTFTITNVGGAGADISTPILNSPQNAILGVGRIAKKPAVYNDEICVRHMLWLNVTFDHRAMDGAPVARFLDTLSTMIQNPVGHING
ncbi:MAG: 2-oxo acid dehydrogenase subunit E2, partial [Chloroflexi bacterium]|nr:2-oxo acid dehydrogenase subunit E2 [Chloroflexota bacterium]